MPRLSDMIEEFIKQMIEQASENQLQIQRNELANQFSCAPSQINYVLTTRFTTDKGYCIESKRGGGGCIVIRRVEYVNDEYLIDIINKKIGDSLTFDAAYQIVENIFDNDIISKREADIMKMAVNDRNLSESNNKNKTRADILKAMIMVIL